ncbi:MAG TPA: hypothetical protein P5186_07860 [Candidatus Paceibacterota bacterium]|nr:hypothetical protein [Verrucomicrobiota bacterium]HRY47944.1 hypothetical protein [Candidatus Paceibacterota bacterium]HSA01538.1 hypothetical protein [Candidatus Paceibacterota bacterium]
MRTVPQPGEVWFVDMGMVGKPRYALVLAAQTDARLALASVVFITKQLLQKTKRFGQGGCRLIDARTRGNADKFANTRPWQCPWMGSRYQTFFSTLKLPGVSIA